MRKPKTTFIITLILFLLTGTAYYWESRLGVWAMFSTIFLGILYLVLLVMAFIQVYYAIKDTKRDRKRIVFITLTILLLTTIFFYPNGVIDFDKLEGKDMIIAGREGVANCSTLLKFKDNKKFFIRSICFGIDKITGTYEVSGDTIKFKYTDQNSDNYKFGILRFKTYKNKHVEQYLNLYTSMKDTLPLTMNVFENNLMSKP